MNKQEEAGKFFLPASFLHIKGHGFFNSLL